MELYQLYRFYTERMNWRTKCMTKDRLLDPKWRNLELKSEMLLSDYDYCSSTTGVRRG